ncbi:NADH:flavin oxidoreductase/NADH oxidase [Luteimonas sp. BDR2-5]|uniref:NADH:flavin oxidoreductase/NADH oxidase n=1 Tax=Proluteimonas luteida TaxID=2878685 RepID=UPI001E602536|nr:NADH:flavin oxidoreductase/NADH oxidase [Luteimonas sp. BDR2-5]MCD9028107.1 NADH:flavin oxidoreductase/NADH oxidase [Luteimonas sp. BDR2-5]
MSALFSPLRQRGLTLRNRLAVSPMCQYSARDGMPAHWHLVHLGSRAVGGAAVVIAEASAVLPEGRISPEDTGIWNAAQAEAWAPVAAFVRAQGAVPAIQLAHAGRKASTFAPWRGHGAVAADAGGWTVVAPSALAYDDAYPQPQALDAAGIARVVSAFHDAAVRALEAGFELVEIHAAHGYLLHQFLSPLSNRRDDAYGGGFEGRTRLVLEVIDAVREVWPDSLPLWLRISATDWVDGGWDVAQSVELARLAAARGVDLVDASSGGLSPRQAITLGPGYQVPFAARIRREAGVATGAVGLITTPQQAERIVAGGDADVVLLARELLRDPYFPYHAAKALGAEIDAPAQYLRAW